MVPNGEGFLYPKVNGDVCIHCGRCEAVCPVLHPKAVDQQPTCFIGRAKDEEDVLRSSSGGVFGELAKNVLMRGGCVFGCAASKPSFRAEHIMIEKGEDLDLLRGSKYYQSEIGESYRQVRACLKAGREVLFSGTPCQVAGLKLFLGNDNPHLLTVEIVCHGVGSYHVFRKFLDELERKFKSAACAVKFKDKAFSRLPTTFTVDFENGERYVRRTYSDPYGRAFMNRLCLRRSCESCPSRAGRSGADITIGDYWGAEVYHPEFDRTKGVSVIVTHTDAGRAALQGAKIELEPSTFYKATRFNPSLLRDHPTDLKKRKKFFELMAHTSVDSATRVCCDGAFFARGARFAVAFLKRCISKGRRTLFAKRTSGRQALPRVGIMTVRRELLLSNYGSFFQHYALREVLKEMGLSPFRIEAGSWIDEVLDWLMPLRILRLRFLKTLGKRNGDYGYLGLGVQRNRLRFIPTYLKLLGPLFECRRDSDYAYIAGGDGIWTGSVPRFFLLDLPGHIRRLSYAPSSTWGLNASNPVWCAAYKAASESYHRVSVREQAGVDVCRQIAPGREVERVLDPVLLLSPEHYRKLLPEQRVFRRPTLFCYLLNMSSSAELPLDTFVSVAEKLGCQLKILGIQGTERFVPRKYRLQADQIDFLRSLRDASFVVTNSFHGAVFSLLLEKQFAFVRQKTAGVRGDQNLRQHELLGRFGLVNRIVQDLTPEKELTDVLAQPISWHTIESTLLSERGRSREWLREALS